MTLGIAQRLFADEQQRVEKQGRQHQQRRQQPQ